MNKMLKVGGLLVLVAAIGFLGVMVAFAQSETPAEVTTAPVQAQQRATLQTTDVRPTTGNGYGRGRGAAAGQGLLALDQDQMHAAIAEALGMTVAEFEAARDQGQSLVLLAQERGVALDAVRDAMATVRQPAIDQALAEGTLTEQQAEWLSSRPAPGTGAGFGGNMGRGGTGPGLGRANRGQQGQLSGGMGAGNNGECPYTP